MGYEEHCQVVLQEGWTLRLYSNSADPEPVATITVVEASITEQWVKVDFTSVNGRFRNRLLRPSDQFEMTLDHFRTRRATAVLVDVKPVRDQKTVDVGFVVSGASRYTMSM